MHNDALLTPSARCLRRRGDAGRLEALEQRVAPAAVVTHWVGLSGNWTDPAHWDAGVPNNADGTGNSYTAIIDGDVVAPTVTIDSHIVVSSLTNAGVIQVNANGSAEVGDSHFAPGVLENSTGLISVGTNGTFTATSSVGGLTTAELGPIHVGGGTFALQTALANAGATLSLDAPNGTWLLDGGSIVGGNISVASIGTGSKLAASPAGGTLDGVTLYTGLDVTKGNTAFVTIVHGLTLNGTATVGAFGFLNFDGTQTLGGTGSVVFTDGAASGLIQSNTAGPAPTLTIGTTITIHGGSTQSSGAQIGDSDYLGTVGGGTIINSGKISADVASATLFLNRSVIVNHGTIEAKNGGHLILGNLSASDGTLSAIGGSKLELGGLHWTNTGTLGETGSTLVLGGAFSTAGLGTPALNGGNMDLAGTLDNTGATLTLDPAAMWSLRSGTILGGTVQSSSGSKLLLTAARGTLDGVTLNADLDVTGGGVNTGTDIHHGLTLNGVATMGQNALLNFYGSQTLGGTGSVLFLDQPNSALRLPTSGTALTIGPGLTVHGGSAQTGGARLGYSDAVPGPTNVTVVNLGKLSADVNATSITVPERLINAGTLEEINGGTIVDPALVAAEFKTLLKTSAPYAFVDAHGTPVKVKWLGEGSVTLVRFTDSNAHGDLFSITTNASDLTSSLSIATTGAGATTSVEMIDIHGSLKALTAPTTNLLGDVSSTHSIGALTLGQVVSGSTIDLGPRAAGDTKTATSLTFDLVANLQLDSATPLLALTAAQWLDQDGTPDVITAPSLGTLTIKAATARALASDFEAGLNLTGAGVAPKALTLGHAAISGQIAGSDWKVVGNVGAITAASTAVDWSTHFTGSLLSFTTTGHASGDLHLGARAAGDLTSKTALSFDTASALNLHSLTPIASLTTRSWANDNLPDVIAAPSLGSLLVKGDTKMSRPLAGDFAASLDLSGAGVAATAKTLGAVTVKGKIDAATWTVTGAAGALTVGSTGTAWDATFTKAVTSLTASTLSGRLHAASIGTVKADNLTHFTLALTQTVSPTIKALGTLIVKNAIDSSDIRAAGSIGTVTAAKILHSKLFAGVQSSVNALPQTTADFAAMATIAKVVVTGTANLADLGLLDSDIAASNITSASITRFAPSNNGVSYGLAADRITTLTLKTAAATVTKINLNTPTPDSSASGDDFYVRIV